MNWLEKGYEMHDPQMIYITTKMYHFEPLFDNPGFIVLLRKLNFLFHKFLRITKNP